MSVTRGMRDVRRKACDTVLTFLLALSMVLQMLMPCRVALAGPYDYNENEGSFYKSASAASIAYRILLDSDAGSDFFKNGENVGNASAVFGFVDVDVVTPPVDAATTSKQGSSDAAWLDTAAYSSKATQTVSYASGSSGLAAYQRQYGVFGSTLQGLGLDQVAMGENVNNGVRTFSGIALQGIYIFASSMDDVMGWAIDMLKLFNPFAIFVNLAGDTGDLGGYASLTGDDFKDDGTGIDDEAVLQEGGGKASAAAEAINAFRSLYGELYYGMYNMSVFVLMPFLLCVGIFVYVMGKAGFGGGGTGRFRRYGIRMLFLLVGIPFLGTLYTAFLNKAASSDIIGGIEAYDADKFMVSVLADFKGWAQESNLSVPAGSMIIAGSEEGPTGDAYRSLRRTTLAVNAIANPSVNIETSWASGTSGRGITLDDLDLIAVNDDGSTNAPDANAKSLHDYVNYLLSAYRNGDTYTAEAYEQYFRESLATGSRTNLREYLIATGDPEAYYQGLSQLAADAKSTGSSTGVVTGSDPNKLSVTGGSSLLGELADKIAEQGNGNVSHDTYTALLDRLLNLAKQEHDAESSRTGNQKISGSGVFGSGTLTATSNAGVVTYYSSGVGLTPIGMYNYLNTTFANGSFRVYSAKDSVNVQSRTAHYAVNFVGGGIAGVFLYLNTFALLAAVAVTGIVYGLGMLFSNLKRSVSLIVSTPMAMGGSIRMIARVILIGLALVAEILGTYITYVFMRSILHIINAAISGNLLLEIAGNRLSGMSALVSFTLSLALASILLIAYTLLAIRLRKMLIGAIDDGVASILQRFMGSSGGDVSGSHLGSGILKGAGLMAGGGTGGMGKVLGGTAAAGMTVLASQYAGGMSDIENGVNNDSVSESAVDNDAIGGDTKSASYVDGGGIDSSRNQGDATIDNAMMNGVNITGAEDNRTNMDSGSAGYSGAGVASAVASGAAGAAGVGGPGSDASASASATADGGMGYGAGTGGAGGMGLGASVAGGAGGAGTGYGVGGTGTGYGAGGTGEGYGVGGDVRVAQAVAAGATAAGGHADAYVGPTGDHDVAPLAQAYAEGGASGKDGLAGKGGLGGAAGSEGAGGEGGNSTVKGLGGQSNFASDSDILMSGGADPRQAAAGNVSSLQATLQGQGVDAGIRGVAANVGANNINLGDRPGTEGMYQSSQLHAVLAGNSGAGTPGMAGMGGVGGAAGATGASGVSGAGGLGGASGAAGLGGAAGTSGVGGAGGVSAGDGVRGVKVSGNAQMTGTAHLGQAVAQNGAVGTAHSEGANIGGVSVGGVGGAGGASGSSSVAGLSQTMARDEVRGVSGQNQVGGAGGSGHGIEQGQRGSVGGSAASSAQSDIRAARAQVSGSTVSVGSGGGHGTGIADGRDPERARERARRVAAQQGASQSRAARDRFAKRGGTGVEGGATGLARGLEHTVADNALEAERAAEQRRGTSLDETMRRA